MLIPWLKQLFSVKTKTLGLGSYWEAWATTVCSMSIRTLCTSALCSRRNRSLRPSRSRHTRYTPLAALKTLKSASLNHASPTPSRRTSGVETRMYSFMKRGLRPVHASLMNKSYSYSVDTTRRRGPYLLLKGLTSERER